MLRVHKVARNFVDTLPLSEDDGISKVENKLSRLLLNIRESCGI